MDYMDTGTSKLQKIRNQCARLNENMLIFDMARELGYWPLIEPIIGIGRYQGYGSTLYKVNNDGLLGDALDHVKNDINTYPFGVPTDEIFDKMFVVCAGKTKLESCFKAIDEHCKKLTIIPRQDKGNWDRSVVMITDKWDTELFREKFEQSFLNYAINENIVFLFYLMNDYGYTMIPFVPMNVMHELQDDFGGKANDKQYALDRDIWVRK